MSTAREPQPVKPSSKRSTPSRRLFVLAVVGLVLVGIASFVRWRAGSDPRPQLPEVDLSQAHPRVVAAVSAAEAQVIAEPESDETWGLLGLTYFAYDLRAPAESCFVQAEKRDADDARWPYYLGMSLATRDAEAAVDAFRRAARNAPRESAVRLRLVEFLLDQQQWDEAENELQAVLNAEPDHPRARLALARLRFAQQRWEESVAAAERAAESVPFRRDVLELLARAYTQAGRDDDATAATRRMHQLPRGFAVWPDPLMAEAARLRRDAPRLHATGQQLLAMNRTEEGLDWLRQAVQLEPDRVLWKASLARAYLNLEQWDEAARFLEREVGRHPESAELQFLFGQALQNLERREEAATAWRAAVEQKPDYAEAHLALARHYRRENRPAEAISAYESVIRSATNLVQAHREVAAVYEEQGEIGRALLACRAVLRLDPDSRESYAALLRLLLAGEFEQEALDLLDAALDRFPEDEEFLQMRDRIDSEDPAGFGCFFARSGIMRKT